MLADAISRLAIPSRRTAKRAVLFTGHFACRLHGLQLGKKSCQAVAATWAAMLANEWKGSGQRHTKLIERELWGSILQDLRIG